MTQFGATQFEMISSKDNPLLKQIRLFIIIKTLVITQQSTDNRTAFVNILGFKYYLDYILHGLKCINLYSKRMMW
jgi:hypothetical protein